MNLARVIGTVVSNTKSEGLDGVRFLFVQPLDRLGAETGDPVVAADATRMAGPGEIVLCEGGREAALALEPWFVPVDESIVGIVDQVSREGWNAG